MKRQTEYHMEFALNFTYLILETKTSLKKVLDLNLFYFQDPISIQKNTYQSLIKPITQIKAQFEFQNQCLKFPTYIHQPKTAPEINLVTEKEEEPRKHKEPSSSFNLETQKDPELSSIFNLER